MAGTLVDRAEHAHHPAVIQVIVATGIPMLDVVPTQLSLIEVLKRLVGEIVRIGTIAIKAVDENRSISRRQFELCAQTPTGRSIQPDRTAIEPGDILRNIQAKTCA